MEKTTSYTSKETMRVRHIFLLFYFNNSTDITHKLVKHKYIVMWSNKPVDEIITLVIIDGNRPASKYISKAANEQPPIC